MTVFTRERLYELKQKFRGKKIAVVGDMMLDSYYFGDASRISPEAPVPVVSVREERHRLGGAANVALNLLTLGAEPIPVGAVGDDNEGATFSALLKKRGISDEGLLWSDDRPTTAKTRVIAGSQHVVRVDRETTAPLSEQSRGRLFDVVASRVGELDAIILEDYNKGALAADLIARLLRLAEERGVVSAVDPKRENFFEYRNATVFKPNRKEAEDALRESAATEAGVEALGAALLERLTPRYAVLTLGEKGMAVFGKDGTFKRLPTKARKVADVSGAGDTVISTLTLALAAGADIVEAATLANEAAGVVCGEVGVVPVESDELFQTASDAV
jgi:D-glycero-beta-D-manno-heptose-7-phosphate kinase